MRGPDMRRYQTSRTHNSDSQGILDWSRKPLSRSYWLTFKDGDGGMPATTLYHQCSISLAIGRGKFRTHEKSTCSPDFLLYIITMLYITRNPCKISAQLGNSVTCPDENWNSVTCPMYWRPNTSKFPILSSTCWRRRRSLWWQLRPWMPWMRGCSGSALFIAVPSKFSMWTLLSSQTSSAFWARNMNYFKKWMLEGRSTPWGLPISWWSWPCLWCSGDL